MADDGFVTGRRHWYCPGQQRFWVSSSFSALLLRRLTLPASNIDAMFQKHRYLMFPSKSDGIHAGVMVRTCINGRYVWLLIFLQSSFGFGQVGGTALVLHPRYLFGALEPLYS